jgi:thioredoxin 1
MQARPFVTVRSLYRLRETLARRPAVLLYFGSRDCNVCKVLKPKVGELLASNFSRMEAFYVDCAASPHIAAAHGVFSVPTVLVYFERREWLRKGRSLSLAELAEAIARPYALLFRDRPATDEARAPEQIP